MKLFLTSFFPVAGQVEALTELVGKPPSETRVAYIENAHDVYNDEASLIEGRELIRNEGYVDLELVDLRNYTNDRDGLQRTLKGKDVFLLAGGNPFYLRWLMKESGADQIITELVERGTVYVAASAAAVVAGPTLRNFDNQDDPGEAKEVIWDGLNLTDIVVVPHIDNAEFGQGCREAGEACKRAGFETQFITDAQSLVINGNKHHLI